MMSKLRVGFAIAMVGALAACHSGVKLDESANKGAGHQSAEPERRSHGQRRSAERSEQPARQAQHLFRLRQLRGEGRIPVAACNNTRTYLKGHPERRVLIQGNTDERGTSEYNLALGQKRAEAVRRAMSLMGVADTQMEAVSLGKEKPTATGHDEASWAQNRRADLVYQQ